MRKLNVTLADRFLSTPMHHFRILFLFINYFIGYLLIYPFLLRKITLWMNPSATYVPDFYLFVIYFYMIISSIYLSFPVLKESYLNYKISRPKLFSSNIRYMGIMILSSILLGGIISVLSGTSNSVNEQIVMAELRRSPFLSFFTILLYSPIVEECVFRGGIYRTLRGKTNVIISMFVTGLLFGLLHTFNSLLLGNWIDIWYLFLYGAMSCLFCYSYEKNQTIYSSIFLHFMNNLLATIL